MPATAPPALTPADKNRIALARLGQELKNLCTEYVALASEPLDELGTLGPATPAAIMKPLRVLLERDDGRVRVIELPDPRESYCASFNARGSREKARPV